MNCHDIHALFEVYPDLPEDDVRRIQVRKHVEHCRTCKEELDFWENHAELLSSIHSYDTVPEPTTSVSSQVMNRIYQTDTWRIPVPERMYLISNKMRRNFSAVLVCCLSLFVASFLFSLIDGLEGTDSTHGKSVFGLHPVASAAASSESVDFSRMPNAVASLTDPFLLQTNAMSTLPNYMLALSIIGTVSTLLIMNWWFRTKS